MSRLIDIEPSARRICITFPYSKELLPVVRSLPQRRWDGQQKAWYVPLEHLAHVVAKLSDHHFKVSAELRSFCRENGRPIDEMLANDGGSAGGLEVPEGTYTISRLNEEARQTLRERFSEQVWLVGEVQSYDRNRPGGHAYFELVERLRPNEDPVARLRVVMFSEDRRRVLAALDDAPEPIRLRDGLAVRLGGKVDLYAPHGSYQFVAREVDPSYTTGEIQQNRERIVKWLDAKGILELNQKQPWPQCPLRVGLITSYESDAYNDFVHELKRSGFGFELTVHNANVQGSRTEASVLAALDYFAARAEQFDVLAIVRGGGSRSDLAYFDTEAIGEAVCRHPLKIVTGVGHQRDRCLLDFVSDSQKTPTAAARACVEQVGEYLERAEQLFARLAERCRDLSREQLQRLRRASLRLQRSVERSLKVESRRLDRLRSSLSHSARDRLAEATRRLDRLERAIPASALSRVRAERQALSFGRQRLSRRRLQQRLDRETSQLDAHQERLRRLVDEALVDQKRRLAEHRRRLRLLDPQRVLERGFAIVKTPGGVATDAADVPHETDLDVRLARGSIRVRRSDAPSDGPTPDTPPKQTTIDSLDEDD